QTLQERSHTLVEMAEQAVFYLQAPASYDPHATAKFWGSEAASRYAALIKRIEVQDAFDAESLEGLYRGLTSEMGLKLVDLAQLTRIALTGKAASPPIFQVAAILGKPATIARLKAAERPASGRRWPASSSPATASPCPTLCAASRGSMTWRSLSWVSGRPRPSVGPCADGASSPSTRARSSGRAERPRSLQRDS